MRSTSIRALIMLSSCAMLAPLAYAQTESKTEPMKPSGVIEAVMSKELKDFYETAASANMLEIEASQLALNKSSNEKIKGFAQQMIIDHTKAGEELKALAESKGVQLPTAMLKRHQAMYDDLKDESHGKDFDNEYRMKMIASHKEAVSLFDKTAKTATDAEVKAFVSKTLPKLQDHGGKSKDLPKA